MDQSFINFIYKYYGLKGKDKEYTVNYFLNQHFNGVKDFLKNQDELSIISKITSLNGYRPTRITNYGLN